MITDPPERAALTGALGFDLIGELAGVWERVVWASDELDTATAAHPEAADLIHHAFPLLHATHELMAGHEALYRAHARELIDRLISGQDTRPATSAEICCACATLSPHNHLTHAANGLYIRHFAYCFPDQAAEINPDGEHGWYEGEIDEAERLAHRRLAEECDGSHGPCRFHTALFATPTRASTNPGSRRPQRPPAPRPDDAPPALF